MNNTIPEAIGFIMDGNRRFAKSKNLPTIFGHKAGLDTLKKVVQWAEEVGVKLLYIYALSTENWNRGQEEVSYLLALFDEAFASVVKDFPRARIRIIGNRSKFSEKLQNQMKEVEEKTAKNSGITLCIALSYGGRDELVHAFNTLLAQKKETVEEKDISDTLFTTGLTDPALIIRTGGEKRLSNFLPWQSIYSELYFSDTLWPAFTKEEFEAILGEYAKRERRFGA